MVRRNEKWYVVHTYSGYENKVKLVQKKLLPGYLLVRMELDDDSWYVVRNTPGVTGFVGTSARPTPIPQQEVDRVLARQKAEKPKVSAEFSEGEGVKVVEGPFADFTGVISEVSLDQSKLEITVYEDRSFTFVTKTPPAARLLLDAAGLEKGSSEPNRETAGTITMDKVREVAKTKLPDLNTNDIDAAVRILEGTARSMGLEVVGE